MACALLLACLLSLFLFTAGCGEEQTGPTEDGSTEPARSGNDIPLATLAQGIYSEYGRFDEMPVPEDAPPECLVITDEEEFDRFISMALLQEEIYEVDFESEVVIAAMQGPKNTGGFAISIMHASQADSEVRVEIEVIEPDPESMTVQVLTSPYHLVKAERADFSPLGPLNFTFVDQNDDQLCQQPVEI